MSMWYALKEDDKVVAVISCDKRPSAREVGYTPYFGCKYEIVEVELVEKNKE